MIFAENRGLVQVARDPEEALEIVERTWREAGGNSGARSTPG